MDEVSSGMARVRPVLVAASMPLLALEEPLADLLGHHDAVVDEQAERDDQRRERDAVHRDVDVEHHDQRHDHRQRDVQAHDEARAHAQEPTITTRTIAMVWNRLLRTAATARSTWVGW